METKTFTVVTPNTKKIFNSNATTFAELKSELNSLGISTTNMSVQEAITKIVFNDGDEDKYLPHDVPFKGQITNNLVFRLTTRGDKVSSGAESIRQILYRIIKEANLEDYIYDKFGRPYTNLSNSDLEAAINSFQEKTEETEDGSEDIPVSASARDDYDEDSEASTCDRLEEVRADVDDIIDDIETIADKLSSIEDSIDTVKSIHNENIDKITNVFKDFQNQLDALVDANKHIVCFLDKIYREESNDQSIEQESQEPKSPYSDEELNDILK